MHLVKKQQKLHLDIIDVTIPVSNCMGAANGVNGANLFHTCPNWPMVYNCAK